MPEKLEDALKFRQYKTTLEANGLNVRAIRPLEVIRKRNGEVLFAMVDVDATTPDGRYLPPIAVLRGHYVSVLTLVRNAETGEEKLVTVRQRRIANGAFFTEHPAGMCDNEQDPRTVGQRELEEETGLLVPIEALKPLWDHPLYTSPGLLDEAGYTYYVDVEIPAVEFHRLNGLRRGAVDEGEDISVALLTMEEAAREFIHSTGLLLLYRFCQLTGRAMPNL
jgi:8-oxo-dGTP pyrophosphatase MutT (NUDIX family)